MLKPHPEPHMPQNAKTTLAGAMTEVAGRLRHAGLETPELDARLLLCSACRVSHESLLRESGRILLADERARLDGFCERRLGGEPVSRIVGRREFWGREFAVTSATLDPRADSETLIEAALALTQGREPPSEILDLGTGTGCLLISLLGEFPGATGVGIDASEEALAVARANAERLGFAGRARFVRGDWLVGQEGRYGLVVANPPYIPSTDLAGLAPEVAKHDPRRALDGGPDGLEAYRRIAENLETVLAPGGLVLLEIGAGQSEAVLAVFGACGFASLGSENGLWKDLGGHVRCVALARPGTRG
ncbi:MAG: peptide chain release factor N(5)-glutamine methyltransferase [Pseudomonadota bacterium]|nr:peptide chain release factor N(5)-glutamine methyltransferase [Pseudomonadota bacterium]